MITAEELRAVCELLTRDMRRACAARVIPATDPETRGGPHEYRVTTMRFPPVPEEEEEP